MSIEIVLIPLAMAAYAAWKARSIEEGNVCLVETRLKDPVLLAEALRATGATDVLDDESSVSARWGALSATFERGDEGVLTAHVDSEDPQEAIALVSAVDRAYGQALQRVVVERVNQRAASMGMAVVSQMDAKDGAITIVLEEVQA